jgi:competence protein ComEC
MNVSVPQGDEDIKLFDVVSLYEAEASILKNEKNRFDTTSFSDGIFLFASSLGYDVLDEADKTPYYYCIKLKAFVTQRVSEYLEANETGFLNGMLFGDKSQIDDETLQDFRYSGVAHLLAVSGLHTSLWCGLISGLLGAFIKDKRKVGIICILFLFLFCIISGFTPSILRASFMMALVFIAPFFNKEQDTLNSLGFAVVAISLLNPYVVISPSFLLSASATLGILFLNGKSELITNFTKKIKNVYLMKFVNYLVLSVAIS